LNNNETISNETFGARCEKDSKQVHLIIKEQLWTSIKIEAQKKGQTVSAEIRQLLYEHYMEPSGVEQ